MTGLSEQQMMALRLDLSMEITSIVEAREKAHYDSLISELSGQIELLQKQLQEQSNESQLARDFRAKELGYQKTLNELQGQISSMSAKFKQHHANTEQLKQEHAQFKQLRPVETKKKLEETKKKLKELREVNVTLTTRNKKFLKLIESQKKTLERISASKEASKDHFLCISDCGKYKVLGTLFQSEKRPFIVQDMNYRVLNMITGASYVAVMNDDQVTFQETEEIPEDIMSYLESCVQLETAHE